MLPVTLVWLYSILAGSVHVYLGNTRFRTILVNLHIQVKHMILSVLFLEICIHAFIHAFLVHVTIYNFTMFTSMCSYNSTSCFCFPDLCTSTCWASCPSCCAQFLQECASSQSTRTVTHGLLDKFLLLIRYNAERHRMAWLRVLDTNIFTEHTYRCTHEKKKDCAGWG